MKRNEVPFAERLDLMILERMSVELNVVYIYNARNFEPKRSSR
jgi:hypothetical protein